MDIESVAHWRRDTVFLDGSDHTSVEYFVVGSDNDPILLFIHGWGLSPTSYRRPINAIADRGWQVWAPTLPGFGASTPVGQRDRIIEALADRLLAFTTEVGMVGPHPIVAHSLGSGVALEMAHHRNELASSLTLICPIGAAGSAATSWAQLMLGIRKEIGKDTLPRIADALPNIIRHPLAVAASGIAAKHADLIWEFIDVVEVDHIPVHVVLAHNDGVIAKDKLPKLYEKDGIKITEVPGSHGWMLTTPTLVPDLVSQSESLAANAADFG